MNSCNTPNEVCQKFASVSSQKAALDIPRFALAAILGGAFIALGGLLTVVVVGNCAGLLAGNLGLAKFLAGALFPVGLMMVSITGADLFTSNCAGIALSGFQKESKWRTLIKFLILSYVFNFFGTQIIAYFFTVKSGVLSAEATEYLFKLAGGKMNLDFQTALIKGIAANWLVCLGTFMGYAAKDVAGKCLGIWIPVMIFVTLGYEHSIANMFFIPTAIYAGADISWTSFALYNLVPATIGNLIGGFLFVGCIYNFCFLSKKKN